MIKYGCPWIDDADRLAVQEVLMSDWLTQGEKVPEFEKAICHYLNVPFAVAVNSGTSALHLACLALGIGEGSEVWVPAISFVASANCVEYCRGSVSFLDINPNTGSVDVAALIEKLELANKKGKLPDVIIIVDYAGHAVDIQKIVELKQRFNFLLIEDASHALGSRTPSGYLVGSHPEIDASVYSFHPVKMITTAEGGMLVTHNKKTFEKVYKLRSHGIERNCSQESMAWYYEQRELGFNYRLSDVQAALGISQIGKLDKFISIRKSLAKNYIKQFVNLDINCVMPQEIENSSWHLFVALFNNYSQTYRNNIYAFMKREGVGVQVHYIPIYRHPYYEMKYQVNPDSFPGSEEFYRSVLTLPLHCKLDSNEQNNIVNTLVRARESVNDSCN